MKVPAVVSAMAIGPRLQPPSAFFGQAWPDPTEILPEVCSAKAAPWISTMKDVTKVHPSSPPKPREAVALRTDNGCKNEFEVD
jgi:hypothetical protein